MLSFQHIDKDDLTITYNGLIFSDGTTQDVALGDVAI